MRLERNEVSAMFGEAERRTDVENGMRFDEGAETVLDVAGLTREEHDE